MSSIYPCRGCLFITTCKEFCYEVAELFNENKIKPPKDKLCSYCGNTINIDSVAASPYLLLKCTTCRASFGATLDRDILIYLYY